MKKKTRFVSELKSGDAVQDVFYLAEARLGQAKNGPFWSLRIMDKTGEMPGRIWSPQSGQYRELQSGLFVVVSGKATNFNDQVQMIVDSLETVDESEVDMADFLAMSDLPPEELWVRLAELLRREIGSKSWRRFCARVLGDDEIKAALLWAPGAKSIHHAYAGGLLEHTLAVCQICLEISRLYPILDRDCLLAAAAFHDLGKAWELSSGLSRDYTNQGRLVGHVVMGLLVLNPFLEKAKGLSEDDILHFKHLLLSHHGEYEFGAPRRPKTAEAWVLHLADNMDAKLKTTEEALNEVEPGHWSPYVRSMNRFLFQPVRPPKDDPRPRSKSTTQLTIPLSFNEDGLADEPPF